jgi:hypothetical protein
VQKCPSCGVGIQEGRPFCSACGKVPNVISGPSYGPTWAFVLIGLLVVLFAVGIRNARVAAVPASVPTPAPDDAAILIQRCGKPDSDSTVPGKSRTSAPERRWLLYSAARVRVGLEQDSQAGAWKSVGYFDPASKKRLDSKQVLKRFPCATSGVSVGTGGD